MVAPSSPLESLRKILRQEQADGFRDTVVVGGMDRFLKRWADELEPVLGELISYSTVTAVQRRSWAETAFRHLADRAPAQTTDGQAGSPKPRPPVRRAAPKRRVQSISLRDAPTRVKGVSTKNLTKLQKLGVESVEDLLYLFPNRHNDFADMRKVAELEAGDDQTVVVNVWEASEKRTGPRRSSTHAILGDDTGNVRAIWFNNPYMARTLRPGTRLVVSGRLNVFRGQLVFESPEYDILQEQEELVNTGRLVPVYPTTDGLPQRTLRRIIKQALDACLPQLEDFLPDEVRHRVRLLSLQNAVVQAHYPDSAGDWQAARRRLAFDELLLLQLALLKRRREWQHEAAGIPLPAERASLDAFLGSLPFALTGAQTRALDEVLQDLGSSQPMARMLQGDVGSGKTVVAAAALLVAAFNNHQGALMVPTEILAEQHFMTLHDLMSPVGAVAEEDYLLTVESDALPSPVTIGLLLGSMPKRAKDDVQTRLAEGAVDMVVGTHALIQSGVEIPKLGLVVVDEQHRFGVMQRATLREKGLRPHLLAMSATPIPRSLALTVYGDLDMSVIDEMPPGRQPIKTRWVSPDRRQTAYAFVAKEVSEGRQAFIVCPLIEESEAVQSRAAVAEHQRLSTEVYPDLGVGLLHGRMPLREKERVMDLFKKGDLDILVSTPVIEVGIDIPNATVMLIDGADRFGLAQLHQFRGRVGRGRQQSYCLLLADEPGGEARERLRIVERVHDGFELAEEDLRIRGPGDYLGVRQSGVPSLRVARITDQDILVLARREAVKLLDSDPDMSNEGNRKLGERFVRYAADLAGEMS